MSKNAHAPVATSGNVRRPGERSRCSRSQPTGNPSANATARRSNMPGSWSSPSIRGASVLMELFLEQLRHAAWRGLAELEFHPVDDSVEAEGKPVAVAGPDRRE